MIFKKYQYRRIKKNIPLKLFFCLSIYLYISIYLSSIDPTDADCHLLMAQVQLYQVVDIGNEVWILCVCGGRTSNLFFLLTYSICTKTDW